jgi:hypothetical protein
MNVRINSGVAVDVDKPIIMALALALIRESLQRCDVAVVG